MSGLRIEELPQLRIEELPLEYDLFFHAVRKRYLIHLLSEAKGNQCRAATLAGVHRNTINRMLEEEGIRKPDIRRIQIVTTNRNGVHAHV